MSFFKKFRAFQKKIDLTPRLVAFALKMQSSGVNIFFFLLFILIGFFGLFIPIIQGWLTITLAFTFLGFKPFNRFLKRNRKSLENIGSVLFTVTIGLFALNLMTWGLGVGESPFKNLIDVVQFGREDVQEYRDMSISIVGLEPEDLESLSFLDYHPSHTQAKTAG